MHGLLLLENIKQQVNQLAGTLNILMAKVGSGLHAPTYEMPEEFQFPRARGAVRKCAITSAAMDADICQHTIRWFNLASDREGCRQERQERRRQSQDTLPVPDGQY
ncbi:hypothetical protein F7725_019008 [Dissostichus mawsoni]|uniref:Uncharacterized protein n=1 Tax=Dissostichus mawsoni TaxID=36200 RepID=A0A7J5XTT6_DISMA|nr:hypothetical protein F7725_019008 [Dissostichus mawsoni]